MPFCGVFLGFFGLFKHTVLCFIGALRPGGSFNNVIVYFACFGPFPEMLRYPVVPGQ